MSNKNYLGVVKHLTEKLTTLSPKDNNLIDFTDTDLLIDNVIKTVNETEFNDNNRKPRVPISQNQYGEKVSKLSEAEKLAIEKLVEDNILGTRYITFDEFKKLSKKEKKMMVGFGMNDKDNDMQEEDNDIEIH